MSETIIGVFIGAAGSLLAAFAIWFGGKGKAFAIVLGSTAKLAVRLKDEGITRVHFSRNDYPMELRDYLATANKSIDIVSVSLGLTNREGKLCDLFRDKIYADGNFLVRVSLLEASSVAVRFAANALDMSEAQLNAEIGETLTDLVSLKKSLPSMKKQQLRIYTHDFLPMGSVIMIDADHTSGTIQIETKLFKAPRTMSFGFEMINSGRTDFFKNQFLHWQLVFSHAKEII